MKNNILKLSYLLLGLFIVFILYLSYLQLIKGPELAANPYNRRLYELEAQVRRGTILDAKGVALAKTEYREAGAGVFIRKGPLLPTWLAIFQSAMAGPGLNLLMTVTCWGWRVMTAPGI